MNVHTQDVSHIFKKDTVLQGDLKNTLFQICDGELWGLEKFIDGNTCKQLIALTEKLGFEKALLTTGINEGVYDKSVRDSTRVMIDCKESGKFLYEKLRECAPLCCQGAFFTSVNERLRFLKYVPGQYFKAHYDGCYPASLTCKSMGTLHIYLNTVEEGGETTFYDENDLCADKYLEDYEGMKVVRFKSIEGRVAMFRQQGWLHEGSQVIKGVKHTLRSDLMYTYLTNEEIDQLPPTTCGLCKSQVVAIKPSSCEHRLLYCKCPPFYANRQFYQRCAHCNIKLQFSETPNTKQKCQIF